MAYNTDLTLRNKVIYQVFPRQYSKNGNLKGVTDDLQRIKELGTDILYLLPIHPIGVKNKKGSFLYNYLFITSYNFQWQKTSIDLLFHL